MRPPIEAVATLLLGCVLALGTGANAAGAQATTRQTPSPEEIQRLMARSMELGKPGPEHERLARLAGTWSLEAKIWPSPGAEPQVVHGSGTAAPILGGRFLVRRVTLGEGMFAGESMTIIGFDRRSEEYTLIELDTVGTYWITAAGPADASGSRAVLSGTDDDPVFEHTQEYDFVLRFVDDDTWVTEIIFKDDAHTGGGGPFKMVEMTARRRS